jgi:thioredoxin 2
VVQINSDENQSLAARFAVRGIPVMLLLRNGREVARLAGAQTAEAILSWFQRLS